MDIAPDPISTLSDQADNNVLPKALSRTVCLRHADLAPPMHQVHPRVETLYARGNLGLLERPCLALVGSRRATAQGTADAHWFAQTSAQAGLVIVSGLAVGIDAAAHRGALSIDGGTTIAVLAHGLDQIYPTRHQGLAAQILASGGLLLSEYPDGVPARPFQFVHRNRIIAAISRAVCVIEAGQGSGSLITALNALELGHDVFAVPGSIHLSLSAGAHQLIRQGAGLVASPTELLFDMGILDSTAITQTLGRRGRRRETAQDPRLSPVLETLEWTGQSAAVIASRLQWPLQDALVGLLLAENCSQARRLPNGDWVRFQDHR